MKVESLQDLRDLVKDGWLLGSTNSKDWNLRAMQNPTNVQILRNGYYVLKKDGICYKVSYCRDGLDEHDFKVGDKVQCKPGYTNRDDLVNRGGIGYVANEIHSVIKLSSDKRLVQLSNQKYVWARCLKLLQKGAIEEPKESNIEKAKRLYPIGTSVKSLFYGDTRGIVSVPVLNADGSISASGVYIYDNNKWAEIVVDVKPSREELLAKAKRLYPLGTRYQSIHGDIVISSGCFSEDSNDEIWGVDAHDKERYHSGYVFYHDKWAEILANEPMREPEELQVFAKGDIIELVDSSNLNAEKGSRAVVVGYDRKYVTIEWIGNMPKKQMNGNYYPTLFKKVNSEIITELTDSMPVIEHWNPYATGLGNSLTIPRDTYINTGRHSHLINGSLTNTIQQDVRSNEQHGEEREIDGLMDSLLRSKRRNSSKVRASKIQSIIEEDYRED